MVAAADGLVAAAGLAAVTGEEEAVDTVADAAAVVVRSVGRFLAEQYFSTRSIKSFRFNTSWISSFS